MSQSPGKFGALLREKRVAAKLTQEELAAAAKLSVRSVSDLERGVAQYPRKETARLLADALGLEGAERAEFEEAARSPLPAAVTRPPAAAPPAPEAGGVAATTRTLPRDTASFTGREAELRRLIEPILASGTGGQAVRVFAIGGMAGVGKSALAVHAAHQLAPRFPDGQVFLPLHGHTPGQPPVKTEDALASLLQITGVPAGQIPPDLTARAALWRDHLAGKRLLLVLDDAVGHDQVLPLLPGSGGSLVLVTSRRHLTALEDAQSISLDTLPPGQAAELLVLLATRSDLDSNDPAIGEITRLCGYLPLAIGMLARQLHHHPTWTISELAGDLAAATTRLEYIYTENLSAAAAFDLSYAELTPGQQQFFRQLGLHPGPDIDAYASAALHGTALPMARRYLDDLYERYLIDEPARGRYRLHDLIREHARSLADDDPAGERQAALDRLLSYYTYAASVSERQLALQPGTRPDPGAISSPPAIPALGGKARALGWARSERANLLACLDYASRTGDQARVVAFTAGLSALLRIDGTWADAIALHAKAAEVARKLGNQSARAAALNDLGTMRQFAGDYPGATQALQEALDIYQRLGTQLGQADALSNLGVVRWLASDFPGAAQALEQAHNIYRDLGDSHGQANVLLDLGATQIVLGDTAEAIQAIEQALGLYQELGDREYECQALLDLGNARLETSDYPAAAQLVDQALDIALDLSDQRGEAWAFIYQGRLGRFTGDYAHGTQALERSLGIFDDLGDPRGRGNALMCLAAIQRLTGDLEGAANSAGMTLDIFSELGEPRGRARSLSELGVVRRLTADYSGAAKALEEAMSIYRGIGDRSGQADVLNEIGALHRVCGELTEATESHRLALALAGEINNRWHQANALAGLGRADLAAGQAADAGNKLRQAQKIFQRIGAAESATVAAELQGQGAGTNPAP